MRRSVSMMTILGFLICATLSSVAVAGFWKAGELSALSAIALRP